MLEVCVDSVKSAINAFSGGARRIELCSALCLGGLTPSFGLFNVTRSRLPPTCSIFVMIRPRPGEDYVYDESELSAMADDVKAFKESGADGFVFGCLDAGRGVDVDACGILLRAADGLPCTFHRAFDVVTRPEASLLTIANIGFARILTSGQQADAHAGRDLIRRLVCAVIEADVRLIIVAGGGIDLTNLREILTTTKVQEFHGSAKAGSRESFDPGKLFWESDESVVREMIRIAEEVSSQWS